MATDAEIRARGINFLSPQKYLQNDYQLPTNTPVVVEEETESFGIPNTNSFTNSGGDGGDNFNRSFSNNPYTANLNQGQFVTNRTSYGNTGYLPGTEPQPSKFQPAMDLIGKGIGMAIPGGNFLMGMAKQNSRENRLNSTDNAFIDMQLANQEQGPSGNLTTQDKYGYNKVSAFGNYADLVSKNAAKANAKNPEDLTDFDRYYQEKEKEEEDVEKQVDFNNFVRQRNLANKIREQIKNKTIDPGFNIHTDPNPGAPPIGGNNGGGGRDDTPGFGKTAAGNYTNQFEGGDPGQNQGTQSQAGGFNAQDDARESYGRKDGGRIGYFFGGRVNFKDGGLASIL